MAWQPHVKATFVGHMPGSTAFGGGIPRFELEEIPRNPSGLSVGKHMYWGQHQGHVVERIFPERFWKSQGRGRRKAYNGPAVWLADFYSGRDFRLPERRVIILTEHPTEEPLEVPKDSPLLAPP